MFNEAFESILQDKCTPQVVRQIEGDGAYTELWNAVADAGFLDLMASEDDGGADLDLAGIFPILVMLGAYATPLPIGQAIVLRTLLPRDAIPGGIVTLAPSLDHNKMGAMVAPRVPFGGIADYVVAETEDAYLVLDAGRAQRSLIGIHHDGTADLCWDASVTGEAASIVKDNFIRGNVQAWGAALHAAQIVGAMTRCFELTLQYGNDRSQFGKPIGKFQSIQHQLAEMAEHVAAARMATIRAFSKGARTPSTFPAAVAKGRASEAVKTVAAISHSVHGAIGITEEYDLQLYTRRLHAWRLAHGSESHWYEIIGRASLEFENIAITDILKR
ncbi:acyl-CoA dehydrogenase family protein [Paraburkholderia unamae]|uniref:Alkylation response protein AidB-like acyl-CoA dehydrogenase n=1 Tax=Paraburkholderia unamae TaxID=219649 RepID=A0ABX5KJ62_9BURK|nr:acyl-CoA dehydrogenase family protein [Paraburkholderia unamae]PVX75160.1 alkylation response protein AidB-like acyl-CoA dehydrogenase [Paraburkholderia unamae]